GPRRDAACAVGPADAGSTVDARFIASRSAGATVTGGPSATGPTAGVVRMLETHREETAVVGERNSSVRWWSSASCLCLLVILGLTGGCRENTSGSTAAPPVVTVARPTTQTVTDYLNFTGNTAPTDSVTLVARVEGYLEKNHFTDGSWGKKGDLLFTIQHAQYKAQLQQAEAQLAAQKASLWHATTELARYTALLKEDAATQTQVDQWRYQKESAEAGILNAQAQVELAKLNLSYTTV